MYNSSRSNWCNQEQMKINFVPTELFLVYGSLYKNVKLLVFSYIITHEIKKINSMYCDIEG